jgi:hypothetical protein
MASASHICERAIADASGTGNALLKIISANDVGQTGSHQCGYYLPKSVWEIFSPHSPRKGENREHAVSILWQDERRTDSMVKWYGVGTRSEYRLTRFGKSFPWLSYDRVGSLLVLVIRSHIDFHAYVLDEDEDIEDIVATLGVDITGRWGIYLDGKPKVEKESDCIERLFSEFAEAHQEFPDGEKFSGYTREVLTACIRDYDDLPPDELLLRYIRSEYHLFRTVEKKLCTEDARGPFASVDEFLKVAATIMNRRKSRAGRSLENHVDHILTRADIPHDMRPDIAGKPDIVIPGKARYDDPSFPLDKLFIVGVKTTCKDRWRQVLNEARRVPQKHILTIQTAISSSQLREMSEAGVTLVVPEKLQRDYPRDVGLPILTVDAFIQTTREKLL